MTDEAATEEAQTESPVEPERALPDHDVLKNLIEPFGDVEWMLSSRQDVVMVPKETWRAFATAAHEAGFEMAADVTAVDYLGKKRTRFEVVANLLSVQHGLRLRARIPVDADDPTCPSLVPVYPGANFFEREIYDLFGISFDDHPDMTRILMPDEWVGHPLRKDYAVGSVPVQFKEANRVT